MTTPIPGGTTARSVDRPATYRLDVAGTLDDHWSDWLGGVVLVRNGDHTTSMTFTVADQAQLHGVLAGIRDLGAELTALSQVAETTTNAGTAAPSVHARVLHTERLDLRPAEVVDADATWAYRRLDPVNEWLTGTPETRQAYRDLFTTPDRLATTVIVEHRDEGGRTTIIGDFMLRREDAWAQAEVTQAAEGAQADLGWVLDPAHTGHGYATEAVRGLLRYCFADLGVHRVVANCFLDNDASWRLMERVGMRRETHAVKESLHRSGRWLDTVTYALLDDEWSSGDLTGRG
jgi:RimJ/RimL family protein N-acetyltransferase